MKSIGEKLPDMYLKPEIFHKFLKLCEDYRVFNKDYREILEENINRLVEDAYEDRKV